MKQVPGLTDIEEASYFNTSTYSKLTGREGNTLRTSLKRALQKESIIQLKKGLYVTRRYYESTNKSLYGQFIASKLREPSYLSTEYVLQKYGILSEAVFSYTSITPKKTYSYTNKVGNFIYQNISQKLFTGYEAKEKNGYKIYQSTKAKALFDYLYLKLYRVEIINEKLLESLRLNLDEFSEGDFMEFAKYAKLSDISKFIKLAEQLKGIKDDT